MSLDNFDKINYELPLVPSEVSGMPANGENLNATYRQTTLKRPRSEDYSELGMYSTNKLSSYVCSDHRHYSRSKSFLTIRHNAYIYHTEEWKPKGCTMYLPLQEDIMINTQNIDQISFETDQFFLADDKGNYMGAKPGNAVHFWRFDSNSRKLYISRSVLFLKDQDFQDMQCQLDNL